MTVINENRAKIQANATDIADRLKKIEENRGSISANGQEVMTLLKAACSAADEVTAVKELDDADKANIATAMEGGAPPTPEAVEANRKQVSENKATLHQMQLDVMTNKYKLYDVREVIEENRTKIMDNYAAAFKGNRQTANQNTDDIFKNRFAIFDLLKLEGPSQENFKNSKLNESNIQYLENRSLLNNRVAKINAKMSAVNAELIAINSKIMEGNEEIVTFNAAAIECNKKLLDGIFPDKATAEANANRIKRNTDKIAVIQGHIGKYDTNVEDQIKKATENREKLEANAKDIQDRRDKIKGNRKTILEEGAKIAEKIRNR